MESSVAVLRGTGTASSVRRGATRTATRGRVSRARRRRAAPGSVKISTTRSKAPSPVRRQASRSAAPELRHRCLPSRSRADADRGAADRSKPVRLEAAGWRRTPRPRPARSRPRRPADRRRAVPVAPTHSRSSGVRVGAVPRHRHLAGHGPRRTAGRTTPSARPRLDRAADSSSARRSQSRSSPCIASTEPVAQSPAVEVQRSEPRNPMPRGRPLPMREPPPHVSDAQVLATVREHWDAGRDPGRAPPGRLRRAPLGRRRRRSAPRSSSPGRARAAALRGELEATYAATAALADLLDFVVAPLPTHEGRRTAALGTAALSVTPWTEGVSGPGALRDRAEAEGTAAMLSRLHAVAAPAGTRSGGRWSATGTPRSWPWRSAGRGTPGRTASAPAASWPSGSATSAGGRRTTTGWRRVARTRPWVPTHGEPHTANQLVTPTGRLLVDWETLRRAPAERDLRVLVEDGYDRPLRAGLGDGRDVRPGVAARRDRGSTPLVRRAAHRHRQRRGRLRRPRAASSSAPSATPGLSRVTRRHRARTGPRRG